MSRTISDEDERIAMREIDQLIVEGVQLIRSEQLREGMLKFYKVITEFPNSDRADDAYYFMGLVYLQLKEPKTKKAYSCFHRLLQLYPDSEYYQLAKVRLQQLEDADDPALADFQKAVELYRKKLHQQALKMFEKLSSDFPDSELLDNSLYYQGLIYEELSREIEADPEEFEAKSKALFDQILKDFPESDAAYMIRARERVIPFLDEVIED